MSNIMEDGTVFPGEEQPIAGFHESSDRFRKIRCDDDGFLCVAIESGAQADTIIANQSLILAKLEEIRAQLAIGITVTVAGGL